MKASRSKFLSSDSVAEEKGDWCYSNCGSSLLSKEAKGISKILHSGAAGSYIVFPVKNINIQNKYNKWTSAGKTHLQKIFSKRNRVNPRHASSSDYILQTYPF